MPDTVLKRFDSPDETRTLAQGRVEVVQMGTMTVDRVSPHFTGADRYAHGSPSRDSA